MIRLDRLLANLGYGSRSDVAELVADGRVTIRGAVVGDRSARVDPCDDVRVDDEALDHPGPLLVMLNKPIGFVCSHDANEGMRAYDLLPTRWTHRNPRVESVGRLDKDSSGMLLMTDDHALLHRLTSPKHHVPKHYRVTLDRPADASITERFASGALLMPGDGTPCRPAALHVLEGTAVDVVMTEGRNRQVRRMFEACGRTVVSLHRTRIGDLALGDLAPGEFRVVAPDTL